MALLSRGTVAAGAVLVVAAAVAGIYRDRIEESLGIGGEAMAITASHGLVARKGAVLEFTLNSGAILALTDRQMCGDIACPARAATQYRYRGWDKSAGGYRLVIGVSSPAVETLAWELSGGDPVLINPNELFSRERKSLALPAKPAAVKIDPSLAEWVASTARDQEKVEAPRLAASQGRATRDGPRLILALDGGQKLVLTDDLLCGQLICPPEIYSAFEYRGADPKGRFHAVGQHFYESGVAYLIDARNGGITPVAGPVSFAPDGSRAVATMNDPEPRGQHDIEIWSLAGAAPVLEYCYVGDGANTYETVRWDDPEHIRFTRGKWQSDAREPVMLVHDATGWHSPVANCR